MKAFNHPVKVATNKGGQITQRQSLPAKIVVDNRSSTVLQRKVQQSINASPRVLQAKFGKGLPAKLKANLESLSGLSLNDIQVHYNSSEPKKIGALAYAQGNDIYLSPGQEKHLAHEAWHVVQQKQGRVRPTAQLDNGAAINDNVGLEMEADRMGQRSMALGTSHKLVNQPKMQEGISIKQQRVAQLVKESNLLFTASGKYAVEKDKGRYILYGKMEAAPPMPVALYTEYIIRTEDTDREFKRWIPNVAFLQSRDVCIPPGNKSEMDEHEDRKALFSELATKHIPLVHQVINVSQAGGIVAYGVNDCEAWARSLQSLIKTCDANIEKEMDDKMLDSFKFDLSGKYKERDQIEDDSLESNYIPYIGDLITQVYRTPGCNHHCATVVATDNNEFITLEAHVSKDIDNPQFHFYKELFDFTSTNNISSSGIDLSNINGHRGSITPYGAGRPLDVESRGFALKGLLDAKAKIIGLSASTIDGVKKAFYFASPDDLALYEYAFRGVMNSVMFFQKGRLIFTHLPVNPNSKKEEEEEEEVAVAVTRKKQKKTKSSRCTNS